MSRIPYGTPVDIVMSTTVPEIFRSVNCMSSISDFKDVFFIGLNILNFGNVSISDGEFKTLLQELFQENNVKSVVVSVNGLLLRKEVGLGGVFMYY